PASVNAGQSSTATITTDSSTVPGTYPITITGTGTAAAHGISITLTITGPPPPDDFSIAANPTTISVAVGQGGTSTISSAVTSGNPQTVALSAAGAPADATLFRTPASVTAGQSSTATITTDSSTVPGDYPITITGTGP